MVNPERFSFQLKDRDDIREPFRSALKKLLPAKSEPVMMVFTPSLETTEGVTSASVLVLEADRWHLLAETENQATTLTSSNIDRTVLVEMTVVLLLGRLKFDFATKRDVKSVVIEFNTVMEHLYHAAAEYLLGAMKSRPATEPVDRQPDLDLLHFVPLKFRNSILRFAPPGEHILSIAYWPAIVTEKKRPHRNRTLTRKRPRSVRTRTADCKRRTHHPLRPSRPPVPHRSGQQTRQYRGARTPLTPQRIPLRRTRQRRDAGPLVPCRSRHGDTQPRDARGPKNRRRGDTPQGASIETRSGKIGFRLSFTPRPYGSHPRSFSGKPEASSRSVSGKCVQNNRDR
jgi:hypothetical protein